MDQRGKSPDRQKRKKNPGGGEIKKKILVGVKEFSLFLVLGPAQCPIKWVPGG